MRRAPRHGIGGPPPLLNSRAALVRALACRRAMHGSVLISRRVGRRGRAQSMQRELPPPVNLHVLAIAPPCRLTRAPVANMLMFCLLMVKLADKFVRVVRLTFPVAPGRRRALIESAPIALRIPRALSSFAEVASFEISKLTFTISLTCSFTIS